MSIQKQMIDEVYFKRMAHGDIDAFKSLAYEFFRDSHEKLEFLKLALANEKFQEVYEFLHRCKGAASMFGLVHLSAFIETSEKPDVLSSNGFDLTGFESELFAAEDAISSVIA